MSAVKELLLTSRKPVKLERPPSVRVFVRVQDYESFLDFVRSEDLPIQVFEI
jgi:hypothetical protein